tara:strand:- start:1476 stop:2108 length:633 start_codon:yes stop_codon:yes gene_type:complete
MVLEMNTKENILNHLREYGFVIIPEYWSSEKCKQALSEFKKLPQQAFEGGQGGDLRCQHSNRYLSSSNEFLNDTFIQDIADNYSLCNRADRVVAGIVKYNPDRQTDSGGGWHVDSESDAQLKSFMYLTDVTSENGPFVFVQKSRDLVNKLEKHSNLRISEELVREHVNPEDVIEMTAPAGTCILADSTYLHRGKQIESGIRYTYTTYFYE